MMYALKFFGKFLSQIREKCGYFFVITMVLATPPKIAAADNLPATSSVFQQITITGTVTDEQGETLPGANVVIKGTLTATVSSIDGRYSISVPGEDAVLVFSFIGYQSFEIEVGNQRTINVTLLEDASHIEELVVVGYGTQRKETLTGAVVSINNEQLITTKNPNMQNMLTGKLPGLRVVQSTSEPGQFTNQFDIRGFGTPLFVVDGVPRGDFPRMDPNEIESISILKDASAAIYGVRAANGVVLITTKTGANQKTSIEYSGYYGIQMPSDLLKPVSAWERTLLVNEMSMRSVTSPTKQHDDQYFQDILDGKIPDTDWYSEILRKTAPQQQHNISVRGGSEKIDYFVNFGYNDQGSFWKTNSSNYNRYNFRTNLNAEIIDGLKASVRLNFVTDQTRRQRYQAWEIFARLWRSKPTDPIYANNTEPYFFHPTSGDIENVIPLIHPELSGEIDNKRTIMRSNMSLNYKIPFVEGLTTNFMFSYDRAHNDDSNFRKEYSEYIYNAASGTYTEYVRNSRTELRRDYSTSQSRLWNLSLNYDNTFYGMHNVNVLLLYEESYGQSYDFWARRFFSMPIPFLFAGDSDEQIGNGSGLSENANRALVGRMNYDFQSKYLFDFTFRYEGSSRFPKAGQFAFFPSVSLGYRISEELFFKDNIDFINNLKIRGSWGQLGSDDVLNFQWIEGFDYPVSNSGQVRGRGYVFGSSFVNGLGFRNAPNPDLTWVSATIMNLGIDVDLWRGMLGLSFDLFQRDRDGLLATPQVVVPGTFGSGISDANLNGDRTKGFELEFKHHNRINQDLRYNATAFVSMTRTMRTKIVQPSRNNSYDYWRNNQENRYLDIWFGREGAGVYQDWDQIANCMYATNSTVPGDPIYLDWNGDGSIDGSDDHPIATTINPGSSFQDQRNYPLMNFALTLGAQYKWLDLVLQFQGSAMAWVSYGEQLLNPLSWDGNALELMLDRWRPADPDAHPYDPSIEWVSGRFPYGRTRAAQNSTFNIQNGAYMRLKNVELGFTLPQNAVMDRLKISSLRLFVNAYNLFTITNVIGLDPERPTQLYGYMYPLNRTFNFGGTITF